MAKRPPIHNHVPYSRKPYQRQTRARTVVGQAALDRSRRVKARDAFTCCNTRCGVVTDQLECDHVIAIAYGGPDTEDNCQSLCVRCHKVKSQVEAQGMQLRDPHCYPLTFPEAKRECLVGVELEDDVNVKELFAHIERGKC